MAEFVIYGTDGEPVLDWRAWERPKTPERRWKAGRSGVECARAWLPGSNARVPLEILQLLDAHPATRDVSLICGYPEHVTRLPPDFGSDGRTHDLDVVATLADAPVTLCVEAVADEKLGKRLGPYAGKTRGVPGSKVPGRIASLLELLWGASANPGIAPWSGLRYDLLTGVAASVLEAERKGASMAIFVLHEFRTTATKADKLKRNESDYAAFIQALFGISAEDVRAGVLYGPHVITRREHLSTDIQLLVGKAVYDWQIPTE